jgi:hypothetical protein
MVAWLRLALAAGCGHTSWPANRHAHRPLPPPSPLPKPPATQVLLPRAPGRAWPRCDDSSSQHCGCVIAFANMRSLVGWGQGWRVCQVGGRRPVCRHVVRASLGHARTGHNHIVAWQAPLVDSTEWLLRCRHRLHDGVHGIGACILAQHTCTWALAECT